MRIPFDNSYVTCLDTAPKAKSLSGDHNTEVLLEINTLVNSLSENHRIANDILKSVGAEALLTKVFLRKAKKSWCS